MGAAVHSLIDDEKPLLPQLLRVEPAEYQAWLRRTSRGKARFFASDKLEAVTKVQWWMVPLLWLPLAAMLAWRSARAIPVESLACTVASGVLAWQLIEYSLHRWLFHAMPGSPLTIVAHFLMHGNHHKYPSDVERLVFPPLPACLPAFVIYSSLNACLAQAYAQATFSGVLIGYVAYDCIHYLIHSGQLRGSLRRRHLGHHFSDDTTAYGISSPILDMIFCTRGR